MFWHIETDIVCLFILGTLYYDLRRLDFSLMPRSRLFSWIVFAAIIGTCTDITASLCMDYIKIWWLYQLLNIVYFAFLGIVPMMWFYYVLVLTAPKFEKMDKLFVWIAMAFAVAYMLICLSNPVTELIFSLSRDMDYERGPLFFITIAILAFYSILTLVTVIVRYKRIVPRSRAWLLMGFFVILSIGVYVQLAVPGMLLVYASQTIMLVATYYYIQNRRTIMDGLTGLLNRATGEQQVEEFIDGHMVGSSAFFIITDLDNFKTVNDTKGHRYGDKVLKEAAAVCREVFPPNTVLSRLGGDEFLILVDQYGSLEELGTALERINILLHSRFTDKTQSTLPLVSMSMGVSQYPEHGSTFSELYENADIALYQAKWSGRNKFVIYDPMAHMSRAKLYPGITPIDADTAEASRTEPDGERRTMLIVDDSAITRTMLEKIFSPDYKVLLAEDTVSALRLLRRYGLHISMILLDLIMPGRDGLDFLCEKRRNAAIRSIPVIVVTSSNDEQIRQRALDFEATDIVDKPIDPELIRFKVDEVLSFYGVGFWYNDRYQREMLALINESMNGGVICIFNEAGFPADYVSQSLLQLMGYRDFQQFLDETDGSWIGAIHSEDLKTLLPLLAAQLSHDREYTCLEYRVKCRDGEFIWVRDNGKMVVTDDGRELIIGLCINITDTIKLHAEHAFDVAE